MEYDSLSTFKKNVRITLKHLNISPNTVSQIAGYNRGWLADIMSNRLYKKRIGTDIVDEIGILIGVPPWVLIDPNTNIDVIGTPMWERDKKNDEKEVESYSSGPTAVENVTDRLHVLGITKELASEALGYQSRWLYNVLDINQKKFGRLGTDILDQFGMYFASPPWSLIKTDYEPEDWPEPDWLSIVRYRKRHNGKNYRRLNL